MAALWSLLSSNEQNGLAEIDVDKALNRIPAKQLGILTFKRVDAHIKTCALQSRITIFLLILLAAEKMAEIFHVPHFFVSTLLGQ
jgi:hypothetical protein